MRAAAVLPLLVVLAACSAPATAPGPPGGAAFPPADSLVIDWFSVEMRLAEGEYRFTPKLVFRETSGTTGVMVRSISFALDHAAIYSGRVAEPDLAVPANGTSEFGGTGTSYVFTSPTEAGMVFVTVDYLDDVRRGGRVAASSAVVVCSAVCDAHSPNVVDMAVSEFTAVRTNDAVHPRLTVTEKGGRSGARIENVHFSVVDGWGLETAALSISGSWHLPAGGQLKLFQGGPGPPVVEIPVAAGSLWLVAELRFVDDAGRIGSVSQDAPIAAAVTAAP